MDLFFVLLKFLLIVQSFECSTNKGDENFKECLFSSPGLVWIENISDVMFLQHVYLTPDLWRKKDLPEPIPIARTLQGVNRFTHIDVDIGNKTIVMADAQSQKIMALTFDNLGLSFYWDLYEGTSKKVNGIAIDWKTDVVYWTDAAYDVILAVSLFSPNMAVAIVETQLDEPYGIVTYPQKGYLFWTDVDRNDPRLMRSTLGGRHITKLRRFRDSRAMSLFIDTGEDRLYWVSVSKTSSLQGVSSCDINGNDMRHLQIAVTNNYFDIGIFEDQLMYIEHGEVNVYQKTRSSRGPRSKSIGSPLTMSVIDKNRQEDLSNPCLLSRCPGVCTYTEDCFCSELLVNRIDPEVKQQYCGHPRAFSGFLLPKGDGIYTLKTNFVEYKDSSTLTKAKPTKLLDSTFPVKAVTSDVTSRKIYFYEYRSNIIKSLKTTKDSMPEIVTLAVGIVGGLAFDTVRKHLYWTDTLYGHIMVIREDGMFPYALHRNLEQPKAIAIHPQTRLLLWSETGAGKLMKSYLDGSSKNEIYLGKRCQITDIAIDSKPIPDERRQFSVYLCDDFSIYETDLDGSYFITHYRKHRHLFTGLTIVHDYLVVTDTDFKTGGLHVFDRKASTVDQKMLKVGEQIYPDFRYGNWYGVEYHHKSNQPEGFDICRVKRAKCDQLCLPGQRDFRCVCSIGYVSNGTSCEIGTTTLFSYQAYKPFLLLVDKRYAKLLQINAVTRQFVAIPVHGLQQPYSIAYDPVMTMIYWSDLETGTISRSFVNGTNQEIIKHDPRAYFIGLFVEPGSRLLFYVIRNKPEHDRFQPIGSVAVMNIDTRKGMILLDRLMQDPHSLAVNTKHGYIFLTEQTVIWRFDMDRTNFTYLAEFEKTMSLATIDDYVYFANEVPGETYFEPIKSQILRVGVNLENVTLLFELFGGSVSDLTVDKYFIYWINETTRSVQRGSLEEPGVIEDFGPREALFHPTGLYVSPVEYDFDSICSKTNCFGVCLPTPLAGICEEMVAVERVNVHNDSGLCTIPEIKNSIIENNNVGHVVPHGYKIRVKCFPAHRIIGRSSITCLDGTWSEISECVLDYDICGTPSKGYKVYRTSGVYFAYPEATKVDVICIGGGGGGYDATNEEIVALGKAGDGGDSRFGTYLNAFGGKGGTATKGGDGGLGHDRGGSGTVGPNCTTGGTACQKHPNSDPAKPGYSTELFCGSGAFSEECTESLIISNEYSGPGGKDGNGSEAGYFGGGAGSHGGGSGGGGGGSRLVFTLTEKEIVSVTVGQPGYPSYGHPAPGLVVVTWGNYRAEDYVWKYDVINNCVLDDVDKN